jgi:hypothetical protein
MRRWWPDAGQAVPRAALSEPEDQRERVVDRAQLGRVETSSGAPEADGVNYGDLLDKDSGLLVSEIDGGTKACRPRARRCWRNQRGAEIEKLVRLHNNRIACTALLAPARATGRGQAKDFAANHLNRPGVAQARPSAHE